MCCSVAMLTLSPLKVGVLRLNWFVILSSCIVFILQLRFVSVIFWIEDIKLLGAEVFIVTF